MTSAAQPERHPRVASASTTTRQQDDDHYVHLLLALTNRWRILVTSSREYRTTGRGYNHPPCPKWCWGLGMSVTSRIIELLSAAILGCVPLGWSGSGSVIQDHSDHGASKEPMNPWSEWIRRFLCCTMIRVILIYWSGSGSPQRNAPLVSFAAVTRAVTQRSSHKRLLTRALHSFPSNWPIRSRFPFSGNLVFVGKCNEKNDWRSS